jgi:hypothetical protein
MSVPSTSQQLRADYNAAAGAKPFDVERSNESGERSEHRAEWNPVRVPLTIAMSLVKQRG